MRKFNLVVSHAAQFVMEWTARLGHGCSVTEDILFSTFENAVRDVHVDLELLDALMRVAGAQNNSTSPVSGIPHWEKGGLAGQTDRSGMCLYQTTASGRLQIVATQYELVDIGKRRQELELMIMRGGEHEGAPALVLRKIYEQASTDPVYRWPTATWQIDSIDPALIEGREDVLMFINQPNICHDIRQQAVAGNATAAQLLEYLRTWRRRCADELSAEIDRCNDPDQIVKKRSEAKQLLSL